ncbi:hypothetical protein Rhe02_13500 [Rhizocola hellebori]|uniref:Uncharacterized protein n=1 Tax=Rhizocola hellebori TaxID=1392758 RepID=A0A8J3VES9_9ACTN|nr:hypothetical protein Rhe02_13500 [Rhizocola hellebori]
MSRALVTAAARRWPDESQMRREWLAELDFLASQRGSLHALSYAVGLAFARPAQAPAIGFTWRTAGTAFFLLAGPASLLCLIVLVGLALGWMLPSLTGEDLSLALLGLIIVNALLAGLVGRWFGARSVMTGPAALAVAVGLSVIVSLLLVPTLAGEGIYYKEILAGVVVWAPGLVALLFLVAKTAQRRHSVRGVLGGLLAWLVVLDVAIVVEFWPRVGSVVPGAPELSVFVGEHAPMWFVYALTNNSFGVLNAYERFQVADDAVLMPHALLPFGVYAMFYAVTAIRRATEQSAVQTGS